MLRSSVRSLERIQHLCLRRIHNQSRLVDNQLRQFKSSKTNHGSLSSFAKIVIAKPAVLSDVRSIHVAAIRFARQEESLDQSLHRIDSEIRRTGRIHRRELEEILEEVRQLNSMTSNQSLMIIRCCGELVPEETFENRTKLVQEVWKLMDKLKVPLDISHYNALLRVYLENEYMFNPTEFLQELSTKGLEPNRVTFQRLIARFCQDGDIDGASTILVHMKEKQLPINVHVFNALILGHAQAGDMQSAEGILGVMKQAGLEPNDDSFATLLRGYAKKGDMENIKRIVSECEEKEIYLVDRDFLEVIFTLVASNHKDLVKEVLPMIKRHAGFNQEVTNVVLRLVSIGQEDAAFELLKEMPRQMRTTEDGPAPSGTFFIRQLVTSDAVASEKVVKICHEMVSSKLNPHALLRACEFALDLKKFEKAFDFIEALKESGFPIRQHYFWPFFATSKTEQEVYYGLKCMTYMDVSPTVETLRDYIIPALLNSHTKSSKSYEHILEKLSNYTTIPASTIVPAALQYILQNSQLQTAAMFALKHRVRFNHIGIRRALIDAYFKTRDAKAFVEIVASAGFDGDDSAREAMGIVLMDLLENCRGQNKVALLMPILEECLSHGLGLSNSSLEWIQSNLGEQLTPEVSNAILKLTSGDLSLSSSYFAAPAKLFVNYEDKSTTELEDMLKAAEENGRPVKGIQKALLINFARERQLEKAEALFQKLLEEKFIFTPGVFAIMLDLYCDTNKLDKAREMYQRIQSREFFLLDDLKILRYAQLLIANDLEEECLQFLKTQPRDEERVAQGANQVAMVWKLLNAVAEKGNVEKVKEVFKILKERSLTPVNNVVLGPLVKAHLVKDDLDGALAEFETCVNEYSVTPWKFELLCRFIKADDADRLQKVLDLSTKQHGEINSLYDLVFAFLECGKVRQAKKIVEAPGFRARNEKLDYTCQQYLTDGKIEELEKLVEITRDIFNVDRNSMYFYLLKAYCKQDDATKALSIWTNLQEENVQPSEELMIYLGDFLKSKNLEVPFAIPEKKQLAQGNTTKISSQPTNQSKQRAQNPEPVKQNLNPISQELRGYLQNEELDKALQLHQRLESEGRSLSIPDLSQLILKMALAGRLGEATRLTNQMLRNGTHPLPRILRLYVGKLAGAGEIDTLLQLESTLNEDLKRTAMLNSRLCVAHVEAGRSIEYFEKYIKSRIHLQKETNAEISQNEFIPVSASTYILQRHPELVPEFEALENEITESRNKRNFYNVLWILNFLGKNYEKAQEIFDTHLNNTDFEYIKFQNILRESQDSKDEELISRLAHALLPNDKLTPPTKGAIISSQLQVLCDVGKAPEALEILKSHLNSNLIQITDLSAPAVLKLKSALEAAHLNFPYVIPRKPAHENRRRAKADTSDSSSGSDTD